MVGARVNGVNSDVVVHDVLLDFVDLAVVGTMVFKVCVPVEDHDLEMLRKVFQPIDSANAHPNIGGIFIAILLGYGLIGLGNEMVLFVRDAPLFDEITQDPLESDDDQRSLHLIHPAPKKVAISPFVVLVGRRQKVHLQVLLMDLLKLALFGRAKFLAVKDILSIS